jgi:acetolactate synthase-1/2/3 large subunit
MNGAVALLNALEREDVDVVFGYPGGAIMPFYDALYEHSVRHVLVRHEAAAAFAAGGYARTSGRVGVCCATSGPGATNLVTGLLDALMDSVPLVAITGQVRTELMGTDGFQEADVCGITQSATKWNTLVTDADTIAATVAEAFAIARGGRPGPVLIDIPSDVLKARVTAAPPAAGKRLWSASYASPAPSHASIVDAVAHIRAAHRPVAIIGGGVRRNEGTELFRRFTELIGLPYVTTITALGAGTPGDPHDLGMVGMHGSKAANLAVHSADLVIALGMRFDDRVTGKPERFARNAKVIHADIDATEFNKIIPAAVTLHGDLSATLRALIEELERGHVPLFHDWAAEAHLAVAPYPSDRVASGILSATDVISRVLDAIEPDAYIATDVGQHQMWAAQRVRPRNPRAFATSAGLGSMGFGLPAAVGAAFAHPGAPVYAICGDGGFQMSLPELATLRRYAVPVKIVLIDNHNLGMVRQWQELFFDARYSATNLSDNPDFAAIARAYSIDAYSLSNADDAADTIARFVATPGPALLHCQCHPTENVWPIIPAGTGVEDTMESKA